MRIGRGNRSTQEKPLSTPQILHNISWDRMWAEVEGSRWRTACAMERNCTRGALFHLYSQLVYTNSFE
jgi:hypothetical protein